MKTTLKTTPALLLVLLLILGLFSFNIADHDIEQGFLKNGETISFSNKLVAKGAITFMSLKKGSYDGSGFTVEIDSSTNISLSDISSSQGPKQDEFILVGCTGSLTRSENLMNITLEKCRKTYYLVDLNSSKLVQGFDTIVRITLTSEESAGKPAEYYCHEKDQSGVHFKKNVSSTNGTTMQESRNTPAAISTIHLTAVPHDAKKDDLFAAKHPASSLAYFTRIEIETTRGRIMTFPQGSYMLCEGNLLTLK